MRWAIAGIFDQLAAPIAKNFEKVAILGGTRSDAEYLITSRYNPRISATVFGIEDLESHDCFLDLNDVYDLDDSFDLILCSQVLEHLWDHQNFFDNLSKLAHDGSYVWVNCPTSNFVHGSPDYYSAGFTASYISNNLRKRNFEIIGEGNIGSERYYKVLHLTHQWISEDNHQNLIFGKPIHGKRIRSKIRTLFLRIKNHAPLLGTSKETTTELKYSTESWVMAKKLA
jgi:SAM-dependent methyltransferase